MRRGKDEGKRRIRTMLNVLPEHQVVDGDMGGRGQLKVHVGGKMKEIKVLCGHIRINQMIRYSSGNVNHRITIN